MKAIAFACALACAGGVTILVLNGAAGADAVDPVPLIQPASVGSETPAPIEPPASVAEEVSATVRDELTTREEADRPPNTVGAPSSTRRSSSRWSRYRNEEPLPDPADWLPPEGPVRIALQAGHWRAHEAPRELSGLKDNGTAWNGTAEWEVNLAIAQSAGAMLEELGYEVDILPAVVPPDYRAHLFIAIHADGAEDPAASGFRVGAPRRDATGRAAGIVSLLQDSYGEATGLRRLPTVTRRMQNYYAFNSRRYEHSLDPRTIAVIIETGFLTSPRDREVILADPDRSARGIVEAIAAFPETQLPYPRIGAR